MTEAHLTVSDTLNATWKNDKKGFGFRMLQKMGWKEEAGLGKDESGITKHIHVKKRESGLGLGMEHVKDDAIGSKGWSATLTSFNGVLDLLKTNYSEMGSSADSDKEKKSKKRKRDKRDSDEVSSEGNNKKKKSKKEMADKKPKKGKPIIATKIRYEKFRQAKSLLGRSLEDKRAILGVAL